MPSERQVSITTPLGEDLLFLHMSGEESLGRMFRFEVSFRGQSEEIDINAILGETVCVQLEMEDHSPRYFHGYVTCFSQQGRTANYASFTADVRPWLWFLTRTSDCRIFQGKTVPDIIKAIFDNHSFSDYIFELSASYRAWEYCVQYRETDFNFVSRLMEQEGIYYYFRHEESKHLMVLTDSSKGHKDIPGEATIAFHETDIGLRHGKRSIAHWGATCEIQPGAYAMRDYNFTKPKSDLSSNRSIPRQHAMAEFEIYDYPGEYSEISEGEQYALTRIEELHSHFAQVSAETDARSMMCGGLFTLSDHPREDQNQCYLVTEAHYDITANDYSSGGVQEDPFRCNLGAILSTTPFRSQRNTPKPAVQGPQTAKVVGPAGEEIFLDKFGRVKVQFHWDRYGESNENSSCWIRVGQVWAGPGFGGQFIPRIGQEVIVGFLEGDPDHPLITGVVYNADNMPPFSLPGNKTQSGLKSRSSPGGAAANCNEIRLEDKKGSEEFFVQAEKDYNQRVKNNRTESIGVDRALDVGNNKTETVGNDRSETIGNDNSLSIANNETIRVGVNHTETVGSNMSIHVGANLSERIDENYTEKIGVDKSSNIARNFHVTIGGDHVEKTSKSYMLAAEKITINANEEIIISTGAASIVLKKDGVIRINGKDVCISGSGKLDFRAKKSLIMKAEKISQN